MGASLFVATFEDVCYNRRKNIKWEDMNRKGIFLAILAAALYALNAPLSKLLLSHIPPTLTAGFLYLGAGIGMGGIVLVRKLCLSKACFRGMARLDG